LHVGDYLVRQQVAIGVDGAIVIVPLIVGIVTPRWIPISRIVIIVSASDEHDNNIVLLPPIAVMPVMPVAAHSIGIAVATGLRIFAVTIVGNNLVTIPRIVNDWFTIPCIVHGWFRTAGSVGDSLPTVGIVICRCGLCRLNPWLRESPRPCRLGFRGLLRRRGL